MVRIAPSLLSADFSDLKGQIALVEQEGADWIHLDVMDGHFVPNLTIGPPVIRAIRKLTKLPFDTHLMITNPERYLESYRSAGADIITVHQETCPHLHRTLRRIKDLGAKAGVCLNPSTPVALLRDAIGEADLVLIMSVNPGFGGQTFIPHSLQKLREAAELIRQTSPAIHLEVDGGIGPETAEAVVRAGADVLVAGSSIFDAADVRGALRLLRQRANPHA